MKIEKINELFARFAGQLLKMRWITLGLCRRHRLQHPHLFFFRGRMRIHGERKKAIIETMKEIGWSVFFCGFTTLVSLLSFLVVCILLCIGLWLYWNPHRCSKNEIW